MNFEIAKKLEVAARTAGMNAFVVQGDTGGKTTEYGVQFESNRFDKLFVSCDAKEVVDYICRNSSADQKTVQHLISLQKESHDEKVIAKASKLIDFVAQRRIAATLLEIAKREEQVAA